MLSPSVPLPLVENGVSNRSQHFQTSSPRISGYRSSVHEHVTCFLNTSSDTSSSSNMTSPASASTSSSPSLRRSTPVRQLYDEACPPSSRCERNKQHSACRQHPPPTPPHPSTEESRNLICSPLFGRWRETKSDSAVGADAEAEKLMRNQSKAVPSTLCQYDECAVIMRRRESPTSSWPRSTVTAVMTSSPTSKTSSPGFCAQALPVTPISQIQLSELSGTGYKPSYMNGQRCVVCNDEATGLHYGQMTCEGCKGFFRRTIQKGKQYKYVCSNNGSCQILYAKRTACPSCRFTRCIEEGMSVEAVLPPDKLLAKNRKIEENRLKRRQMAELAAVSSIADGDVINCRIAEDLRLAYHTTFPSLRSIMQTTTANERQQSAAVRLQTNSTEVDSLLLRYVNTHVRRSVDNLRDFTDRIPGVLELSYEDACGMLRCAMSRLHCLRLAVDYESSSNTIVLDHDVIIRQEDVMSGSTYGSAICQILFRVGQSLQRLHLDATEIALVAALIAVTPTTNRKGYDGVTNENLSRIHDTVLETLDKFSTEQRTASKRFQLTYMTISEIEDQLIKVANAFEDI